MGKGKRTKRQEEELDSPPETAAEPTPAAPVSKGKKKKAAKKQQQVVDSASDKEEAKEAWDAESSDEAPAPVKKGGNKKKNAFAMLQDDSDSDSEEDTPAPAKPAPKKKAAPKNAFALLQNSDSDTTELTASVKDMSVASADVNEGVVDPFAEGTDSEDDKRKKKKGGNKKKPAVDPDADAGDEPVRMKTKAEKAAEKKERDKKKKEQQKAKQKAKQEEKEKENDEFAAALAEAGVVFAEDYAPEEKKGKKKKKKGKQQEQDEPEEGEEEATPSPAPPAADTPTADSPAAPTADSPAPAADSPAPDAEDGKDDEDGGEEGDDDDGAAGSKKKKKKKKKGPAERVTKPTAAARRLKEALDQVKAEEERLNREAEEAEAELERKEDERLEKIRLEDERKQRRKEKEKERKERKKKEGTWMTKAEKEKAQRAQNMLDAMKQQGILIPEKPQDKPSDKPAAKVRYGGRQRNKKKQQNEGPEESSAPVSPVDQLQAKDSSTTVDDGEEIAAAESWEMLDAPKVEEVPEAWDVEEVEMPVEGEDEEDEEDEEDLDVDDEDDDDEDDDEDDESDADSESEDEGDSEEEDDDLGPRERIRARAARAERNKDPEVLRAPILCVLGHVDTGKTKILDKIRHTNVQDGEAGGITQQIGATNVPIDNVIKECSHLTLPELKIPGMLIIDTPGHESFSNLRSRGSSLCDMAILVIDIMHGLEQQTIESLNLLKKRKTPFIVALNKIDRLYDWKSMPKVSVQECLKKQKKVTRDDFEDRSKKALVEIMEQGLNAKMYYENDDPRQYISVVPTSAHSGDGMADLLVLACDLSQKMLGSQLVYRDTLEAMVLEVKAIHGLGTTVDIILRNGQLREGDNIVLAGIEGAYSTTVRAVLTPQPMKELRVKSNYIQHKCVKAAQGIKICARNMENTLAGMPVYVSRAADEAEVLIADANKALKEELKSIKLSSEGVYVQASTLGSLEALLEFLKQSKINYAGVSIGPVHKKDVMKASVMLQHDKEFACLLAFDVKVERDAQEMADGLGVKIFTADIIYHLFDQFTAYKDELKERRKGEHKNEAVFPCRLRILPQCIFNTRDPIVLGVTVINGNLKVGTPLCVPSKEFCFIGVVTSLEINHKQVETAAIGQDVCIKIENIGGDAPKLYGRHFDENDVLVSRITRESIDILKEYFRDDMTKEGWKLVVELKKIFEIM